MDDWQGVAFALQGACVCFGGLSLVGAAFGVQGVVEPFVLGGALFALGFGFGALAAVAADDGRGALAHAGAIAGWAFVLAADGTAGSLAWTGIALLGLTGGALCYRAIRNGGVPGALPG